MLGRRAVAGAAVAVALWVAMFKSGIDPVISGLAVVDRIGLLGVASGQPLQVVELESATVTVS